MTETKREETVHTFLNYCKERNYIKDGDKRILSSMTVKRIAYNLKQTFAVFLND